MASLRYLINFVDIPSWPLGPYLVLILSYRLSTICLPKWLGGVKNSECLCLPFKSILKGNVVLSIYDAHCWPRFMKYSQN